MKWIYKNNEVPDSKPNFFGFVYLIEYTDNTFYIGKKSFYSMNTLKPLKSGEQRLNGTFFNKIVNHKVVQMESVRTESNWRNYIGSSKKTKHLRVRRKVMLQVYEDKLNLTFGELEWMIKCDVLRNKMYHNDNVAGKYFVGKINRELK